MYHIVMYSGGIGSWAAAMRVAEKYGTDNLILLFTDTKKQSDLHPHRGEDADLYRFLVEGAKLIGGKLEWISRGKHVWQIFEESRYMGNDRIAVCSRELKRVTAQQWVKKHFNPEEVTLYLGIDWTERHRIASNKRLWAPYNVEFPMCEEPYMTKEEMLQWAESLGVKRPRLYELGFSHNNCGGFCVKGGIKQFYKLLKNMPERYAYHEFKQEELFAIIGKRHPFIKKMINGKIYYLSLKEFREYIESVESKNSDINKHLDSLDPSDSISCGCFSDDGMIDETEKEKDKHTKLFFDKKL